MGVSVDFFIYKNISSHRKYSIKKSGLNNFVKFPRKHLCQSPFFRKVACNFIKKEALALVLFSEFRLPDECFCEIRKTLMRHNVLVFWSFCSFEKWVLTVIIHVNGGIGNIEYFNTTLEEYRVIYPKGTPYYITKDNFDNVHIIPLEVVFCFWTFQPQYVHNLFLFYYWFQPGGFHEVCSYKKKCTS